MASYVRGAKRNRIDPHRGGIERLTTRALSSFSFFALSLALSGCTMTGLPTRWSGNTFQVGIFLDFARSSARTMHPHGAYAEVGWRHRVDPHWCGVERFTTLTWAGALCRTWRGGSPTAPPPALVTKRSVMHLDTNIFLRGYVSPSARTSHGGYVQVGKRNRIDPPLGSS